MGEGPKPVTLPPRAATELARAVLPEVFASLRRMTAELDELSARFDAHPGADLADRLAELRATGRRLGWVFGVLSSARGAELLLSRREPDGLRHVLAAVLDALEREGVRVRPSAAELPRLAPGEDADWRLPAWLALLFLRAGRASGGALTWTHARGSTLRLLGVPSAAHAALAGELPRSLPGCTLGSDGDALVVRLPEHRVAVQGARDR
jgi:hypothetical protein